MRRSLVALIMTDYLTIVPPERHADFARIMEAAAGQIQEGDGWHEMTYAAVAMAMVGTAPAEDTAADLAYMDSQHWLTAAFAPRSAA